MILHLITFAHQPDVESGDSMPLKDQQANNTSRGLMKQMSSRDALKKLSVDMNH